jgi:hypothetical protein
MAVDPIEGIGFDSRRGSDVCVSYSKKKKKNAKHELLGRRRTDKIQGENNKSCRLHGCLHLLSILYSGIGLCEGPIPRSEDSHALWCVVCDLETYVTITKTNPVSTTSKERECGRPHSRVAGSNVVEVMDDCVMYSRQKEKPGQRGQRTTNKVQSEIKNMPSALMPAPFGCYIFSGISFGAS